ncbi:MAG: bifunctional DNA-formamidopyrimidine glycosylase/DNA-(apurinic or apyrimidinic site) lyase [Elusimicrobiota bacterium]
MPELPEVETIRRILQERLAGRRLRRVVVGRPTFYRRPPAASVRRLRGATLREIGRRGKYLVFDFTAGDRGRRTLTMHLGMSGRLALAGHAAGRHPHCRFRLIFDRYSVLFIDPRRFGRAGCPLPKLGPEPLGPGFDPAYLVHATCGKRAPIKALLLDQGVLAGVGNIYATEALFRARLRPQRAAKSLTSRDAARLCGALKDVLKRAIRLGGCTMPDEAYLDPLGRPGRAWDTLAVYGRDFGECGHRLKIARRVIGGRRSRYCPRCQR